MLLSNPGPIAAPVAIFGVILVSLAILFISSRRERRMGIVAGNGGGISAAGPPLHGFQASADIVIPANGFVVFARS